MSERAELSKAAAGHEDQEHNQQAEQQLLRHFRCCHCGALPYSGSVLLACLHSCCSSCFDKARSDAAAIAVRESGAIRCPTCDELTAAAAETDFAAPTENAFATATVAASAAENSESQPFVCAICSDETSEDLDRQSLPQPAVRWCAKCVKAMCNECSTWHDRFYPKHRDAVVLAAAEGDVAGREQPRASLLQRRARLLAIYRQHPPPCRQHAAGHGDVSHTHDVAELFCGTCKSLVCQSCSQQCRGRRHDVEELAGSRRVAEYGHQIGERFAQASSELSTRCGKLRHLLPGELEGARARDVEVLTGRRQAVVEAADKALAEATRCLDDAYQRAAALAERLSRDASAIQSRSGQATAYASALLEAGGLAAVSGNMDSVGKKDSVGIGVQYLIDQQDAVLQRLQTLNAAADQQPILAEASGLSLLDVQDVNDVLDPELIRRWIGTANVSRGSELERLCIVRAMDEQSVMRQSSEHDSPRNPGTAELSGRRPESLYESAGGHRAAISGTHRNLISGPSQQQPEHQEKQQQTQQIKQQQQPTQQQQQQQTQQQQQQPTQQQQQTQQTQKEQIKQRQPTQQLQTQQQTQQPQQLQQQQMKQQQQQQQQADHLQTGEIHNSIELSEESPILEKTHDGGPAKSAGGQHAAAATSIGGNRSDLTLLPQQPPETWAAFNFRGREMDALCLQPTTASLSVPSDSRSIACTVDGRLFVAALRKGLKQYDLTNGGKKMKSWYPPLADDGNPGCVNVVCTLNDNDCDRLAVAEIHGERVMLLRRRTKHSSSAGGRTAAEQTGFASRPAARNDRNDSGSDGSGSDSENGEQTADDSALIVELCVQLNFGPWGLTARRDLVALSSAEIVKKPVREHNAKNSSFAVMSSKCSPGRRLLLYSQSKLDDGVTLFERELEYDIAHIALTGNGDGCPTTAVLCASVFEETSCAADVSLCFVDAYGTDGKHLWRHMSQELVSSICPVPSAGVIYLAVPGATSACVRAINSSDGDTLADVLNDSRHRVHHPRALAAYLNRDQPALVVMSITGKVTVHPVLL